MATQLPAGILILLVFAAVLLPPSVVLCGFPATLKLERAFPANHMVGLEQLRARDRARHGRLLQSSGGVVDFPVDGSYNPFDVGLYFTRVRLGTPPREFTVQIDTGSDVLWVGCTACNGCPQKSGLQIPLNLFDPGSSSSSSRISCSDQRCRLGLQSSDSGCSNQGNQCSYLFQYGDGSGTSGYYVSDLLHLDMIVGNSMTANSSASLVFGCSTSLTGDLTNTERAVDGILGFGQQSLSIVSQLSSQGIAPRVFSHCLKGENGGGGILVFGEIVEPNIVYTPLVQSQPHYNLDLRSIAINGQILSIDPRVFTTSEDRGTIIDSGTTLAYLAEEAYDPFVNAITVAVSQSSRSLISKGNQCFLTSSSVNEIFPTVTFSFAGGALLTLNPADYLVQQESIDGVALWCLGFLKLQGQSITILGDIVLKNKIFVYDLVGQRIGWANYDCSQSVNVSTASGSGKSEFVDAGPYSDGTSLLQNGFHRQIRSLLAVFFCAFFSAFWH